MKHYCPFSVACPKQRKTLHFLCIVPHRGVAQLVARGIRVPEAAGSSPASPTKVDTKQPAEEAGCFVVKKKTGGPRWASRQKSAAEEQCVRAPRPAQGSS